MRIWTIMTYELRRLVRSRSLLLNQFLLPLVLIFILGSSLSSVVGDSGKGASIKPVHVGIVNMPAKDSGKSRMMQDFLKTPEVTQMIVPVELDSREAAEDGLRTGKYGYAVVVPPGFDSKVQQGSAVNLEFILGKDHTDNLVAGTVFDNYLNHINYMQAAAVELGPEALSVMAPATEAAGESYVKQASLSEEGRTYTATQYYAVSMLLMFLLYSGLTVSNSLFNDRANHTLFRINSMPVKGSELFIGKMCGVGAVTVLQCAAIIFLTKWLFGVDWGNRPGLLLVFCLLMIIASMMLSIIIAMFSKTNAAANSIVSSITVIMTFISGGMAALPEEWVNSVGAFTINHWAMQALLRMMLHSELSLILPNLLVLSLICLVLCAAGIISYRKVGYR